MHEKPLIIILNAGFSAAVLDIPVGDQLPEGSLWRNLLGEAEAQVTRGALRGLTVPGRTGMVLVMR